MTSTSPHQDPTSFLMGSGVPSYKFETPGQVAKGTIVSLDLQQQRDYKTNALQYWDDGKPRMQLRVVLQTDEHDDDTDDGLRAVYVKGESQKAVRDAVRAAGAKTIEVDGVLAVAYIGDGEQTDVRLNPPKLYKAEYRPPRPANESVNVDNLI